MEKDEKDCEIDMRYDFCPPSKRSLIVQAMTYVIACAIKEAASRLLVQLASFSKMIPNIKILAHFQKIAKVETEREAFNC